MDLLIFFFIFVNADEPKFSENECEKSALKQISESNEKVVKLNCDCKVLSWQKIENREDSKLNSELLKRWKITKDKKQYYQE